MFDIYKRSTIIVCAIILGKFKVIRHHFTHFGINKKADVCLLSVYFGIVGAFKKIINGNIEIVGDFNKGCIVRLTQACFITAYCVLIKLQVHRQL